MKEYFIVVLCIAYPLLYGILMNQLIQPIMTSREEERLMVGNVNVTEIVYTNDGCKRDEQQPQVELEKATPNPLLYGYSHRQQNILDRLDLQTKTTFKAIVFRENMDFGIGNMYRSMASVFMLAIVTNRTFYGKL